jgi:hypothetical protein
MAHNVGLNELSNYMLYNFKDTPTDLYERMRLNIDLNKELGIRIFSFPMRFQPTDRPDRGHVGEHWSRYQLRSMQIILQATHGIVSGSPDFFMTAFGESSEEFENLLLWPNKFVSHRFWYRDHGGKSEREEFLSLFSKLSQSEKKELAELLSSTTPSGFADLVGSATTSRLNWVLRYYIPLQSIEESKIREQMKIINENEKATKFDIPEDERVEDAGLEECA